MSRGRNTESGAAQGARRATEAAPDSARRGKVRWSARRKVTVVLELMRGVELEATSRKYAVTAATLTSMARCQGGEDGLKSRIEVRSDRLKIRQLEDENPFLRWIEPDQVALHATIGNGLATIRSRHASADRRPRSATRN